MEDSIEVLQDRVIYLIGQLTLLEKENFNDVTKKIIIKGWNKEIKELKKAQSILSNYD